MREMDRLREERDWLGVELRRVEGRVRFMEEERG